jgi:glutamine cyclotransferase
MFGRIQETRELILVAFAVIAAPCPAPIKLPLQIQQVITRSRPAFTEGLVFWAGQLYESVGLFGQSVVQRVNPSTGVSEKLAELPTDQFGEGLALWKGELLQLTWRQGLVWRWPLLGDGIGVAAVSTPYPREGWGLASGRVGIVASDGSDHLYYLDPVSFRVQRALLVRDGNGPVPRLNELEVVEGNVVSSIWANVWLSYRIVRIDPLSGCVTGEMDLSPLKDQLSEIDRKALLGDPDAIPNGIAYDAADSVLYLTAKKWPIFFKIALPR